MALDDPLSFAALEYLDRLPEPRFNDEAREALLTRTRSSELSVTRDGGPDTEDTMAVAARNAILVIDEAVRLASEAGATEVEERFVRLAFIKFCPGFFPFC